MSVSELLEWFRYTVKVTGFLHCLLRLGQQGVVLPTTVFIFSCSFDISAHPAQCVCACVRTSLTMRCGVCLELWHLCVPPTVSVCVLNSSSVLNTYCQSYSDGSMSVSELLEWFRYTVKVTGFIHCLPRLWQQCVVCRQQFSSSLSCLTSVSICHNECACWTLLTLRGSVYHQHCQQRFSSSHWSQCMC